MAFLWRHKIFTLFLLFVAYYLFVNPHNRFGIVHKGIAVYNKVPVVLFDLYVSPSGDMFLEEDLKKPDVLKNWFQDHIATDTLFHTHPELLVGTGFENTGGNILEGSLVDTLEALGIVVKQMPSNDAVNMFNADKDSLRSTAILLRVKQ